MLLLHILAVFLLTSLSSLFAVVDPLALQQLNEPGQLMMQNRILAQVNGKTISVLDVVKKMDVYLNEYYPEYAASPLGRFQFYSSQWKATLDQMIDNELILADADEKELKTSDAEIREQMVERFGTNVMPILDDLGITYEELRAMIHTEIVVEKMSWYRVNNKALQRVGPHQIKMAYRDKHLANPSEEKWVYQVLSIRSSDSGKSSQLAEQAYRLLQEQHVAFASLEATLKQEMKTNEPEYKLASNPSSKEESKSDVAISLSQEYSIDTKALSTAHRDILSKIEKGSYSQPVSQVSRADDQIVYRIFYLKDHVKTIPPAFVSIAEALRSELIHEAVAKETALYKNRLREKFGFSQKQLQETLPADFEPFAFVR